VHRLAWLTRTRIAILLATAFAGYLLFSAAGDLLLNHRLDEDEAELQREIDQLAEDRERLVEIREYLKTDTYIEGVARNVLGLVRPGESLVVVSSSAPVTPTPEEEERASDVQWWERIYGR
jgi:cell division protein FtsB